MQTQEVKAQCDSCQGTGIYHGFAEQRGVGVICLNCDGTGCAIIKYVPFESRKVRKDIQTVQRSRGSFIGTGVGPAGKSITYNEFLNGKTL
jgi:hypothetical protein